MGCPAGDAELYSLAYQALRFSQIASLKAELTQKDGDIVRIEKELEEFSDIKGDVGEAVDGDDDDRPKDLQTEVSRTLIGFG